MEYLPIAFCLILVLVCGITILHRGLKKPCRKRRCCFFNIQVIVSTKNLGQCKVYSGRHPNPRQDLLHIYKDPGELHGMIPFIEMIPQIPIGLLPKLFKELLEIDGLEPILENLVLERDISQDAVRAFGAVYQKKNHEPEQGILGLCHQDDKCLIPHAYPVIIFEPPPDAAA